MWGVEKTSLSILLDRLLFSLTFHLPPSFYFFIFSPFLSTFLINFVNIIHLLFHICKLHKSLLTKHLNFLFNDSEFISSALGVLLSYFVLFLIASNQAEILFERV